WKRVEIFAATASSTSRSASSARWPPSTPDCNKPSRASSRAQCRTWQRSCSPSSTSFSTKRRTPSRRTRTWLRRSIKSGSSGLTGCCTR
ncbi:unnamed protein product, partial [Ectocarpus sp. 12 AP-2014]